ncbi:MAG: hypothetical protein AAB425_13020, partial [Bdellovibrionota bacterium]
AEAPEFGPLTQSQAEGLELSEAELTAYNDEITAIQLVHEDVTKTVLDQLVKTPSIAKDPVAVGEIADQAWATIGGEALSAEAQTALQLVRNRFGELAVAAALNAHSPAK